MTPLADLRKSYTLAGLSEADAGTDPLALFARWFDEAVAGGLDEPNAMTLATATPDGLPSARVVLLKGVDHRGFTFFTNYRSRKGRELEANPNAALCFLWHPFERQVRIEGRVVRISEAESDGYFRSRPVGSRLGAWASEQSAVVTDRGVLERQQAALEAEYASRDIPRPPHWGGYRLTPTEMEFWQGRPNRLHDRIWFARTADGWERNRLSP
jgi:pyridoxamine 5'-phosphate oxidase